MLLRSTWSQGRSSFTLRTEEVETTLSPTRSLTSTRLSFLPSTTSVSLRPFSSTPLRLHADPPFLSVFQTPRLLLPTANRSFSVDFVPSPPPTTSKLSSTLLTGTTPTLPLPPTPPSQRRLRRRPPQRRTTTGAARISLRQLLPTEAPARRATRGTGTVAVDIRSRTSGPLLFLFVLPLLFTWPLRSSPS